MNSRHIHRWTALLVLLTLLLSVRPAQGDGIHPPTRPNAITGAFLPQPATAWREVWNGQGTLYAAATAPDAPTQVLWTVGDAGRLMRSVDGGTTWRFSRLPNRPTLRALHIENSQTAYVAGDGGALYRTHDGGDTWAPLPAPAIDVQILDVDGNRVWVGGSGGLFLSEDGGQSWSQEITGTITAWTRGHGTWAAGTASGTLYLSTDEGSTWQPRALTDDALYALLITPDDVLYAAGAQGYLARSADGTTWTRLTTGHTEALHALALAADGSVWAAGGGGWAYHVVGDTVTAVRADVEERTLYALVTAPDGTLWAAGDGPDVWRSRDGGETWELVNGGRLVRLYAVKFVDENHGWAVGEQERAAGHKNELNGVVLYSEDGGDSWRVQHLPSDQNYSWLEGVDCVDAQHCWIVGRYGRIFHTEDGGATWQRQPSGTDKWLHDVAFVDENKGIVGGNRGIILRTVDGGQTWQNVSLASNNLPLYELDMLDAQHIAAALDQGYILYSVSGGHFWGRTQATLPRHLRGIDWTDPTHIWVTGIQGYLAVFDPTTFTWSYKEGGTKSYDWWGLEFAPDRKVGFRSGGYCDRYDAEDSCLEYTGGLLAITFNGGKYWQYYETNTPGTLRDVSVLSADRAWAAGDAGTLLSYRGEPSRTYALRAPQPPLIDGDVWDWTVSNTLTVDGHTADDVRGPRPTGSGDIQAVISPWWDDDTLYLLAQVKDDRVQSGDELVFYVDGLGNGGNGADDLTLRVTAPLTGTHRTTGDETVAVKRTATGWRAEISIPASLLGGGFQHNRDIRWTVVVVDKDEEETTTLIRDGRSTEPGPEFGHLTLLANQVTLQSGLTPYGESVDCWIWRAWGETGQNQCSKSQELARVMYVESNDGRDALLRFDTGILPPGVDIRSASLELYTTATRGGHASLTIGAYPLLRDWLFDQVTWEEARTGEPWGKPGANDITDRWATPVGTAVVDATNQWHTWDVTEAVRQWVNGKLANRGLIMKSIDTDANPPYALFEFVGERNAVSLYEDKHPRLNIHYAVPTPDVTATPTPTPQPTPTPTLTPTPTRTPTPQPTPAGIYLPIVLR